MLKGTDATTSLKNEFMEVPLEEKTQKKLPRRRIYFSDGYLDEYSTDDEQEEIDSRPLVNPSTLSWGPYIWHYTWWFGTKALAVCDYLGESLAHMLGITTPKFQYEIEQYKRMVLEEEALKKKIEAENAGWSGKAPVEVLHCPVANNQLPTNVVVDQTPDTAEGSKDQSLKNDSQKWQRY